MPATIIRKDDFDSLVAIRDFVNGKHPGKDYIVSYAFDDIRGKAITEMFADGCLSDDIVILVVRNDSNKNFIDNLKGSDGNCIITNCDPVIQIAYTKEGAMKSVPKRIDDNLPVMVIMGRF
ncbi:hypothetical protein GGI16_002922 [Coemansia sp. S142-1]|nr:hypothetical protein GGI16_002922 [Coemansia sp. S142-1]